MIIDFFIKCILVDYFHKVFFVICYVLKYYNITFSDVCHLENFVLFVTLLIFFQLSPVVRDAKRC